MKLMQWFAVLIFSLCLVQFPVFAAGAAMDAASVGTINVVYTSSAVCPNCKGSGVCESCNGTGIVSGSRECPECHGRGICPVCDGAGTV